MGNYDLGIATGLSLVVLFILPSSQGKMLFGARLV